MLVQYTPTSDLSEDEKAKALKMAWPTGGTKSGTAPFVVLGDKVVNLKELQKPAVPPVRQALFE